MPKLVVDAADFYGVEESAELLRKGIATIWRMIKDGRIVSIKVSGRVLIPKSEIDRLTKKAAD